jgi:hypothetical protein
MPDTETITLRVSCTWRSEHEVEVPRDWRFNPSSLSDLLAAIQQVEPGADLTAATAELVDWEVTT